MTGAIQSKFGSKDVKQMMGTGSLFEYKICQDWEGAKKRGLEKWEEEKKGKKEEFWNLQPRDFYKYDEEEGSYYIGLITCAHNLFIHDHYYPLQKCTFSFGHHGNDETIKWKGKIVPKSVLIPDEYKEYCGKQ